MDEHGQAGEQLDWQDEQAEEQLGFEYGYAQPEEQLGFEYGYAQPDGQFEDGQPEEQFEEEQSIEGQFGNLRLEDAELDFEELENRQRTNEQNQLERLQQQLDAAIERRRGNMADTMMYQNVLKGKALDDADEAEFRAGAAYENSREIYTRGYLLDADRTAAVARYGIPIETPFELHEQATLEYISCINKVEQVKEHLIRNEQLRLEDLAREQGQQEMIGRRAQAAREYLPGPSRNRTAPLPTNDGRNIGLHGDRARPRHDSGSKKKRR